MMLLSLKRAEPLSGTFSSDRGSAVLLNIQHRFRLPLFRRICECLPPSKLLRRLLSVLLKRWSDGSLLGYPLRKGYPKASALYIGITLSWCAYILTRRPGNVNSFLKENSKKFLLGQAKHVKRKTESHPAKKEMSCCKMRKWAGILALEKERKWKERGKSGRFL